MKIEPKTTSEKMLYSTVRIVSSNGGTGTGFFFSFSLDDKSVPVIITNKHVVNYNEKENVNFSLHIKDGESLNINFSTEWFMHENQDLCFCFAGPLLNQIKDEQKKTSFILGLMRI